MFYFYMCCIGVIFILQKLFRLLVIVKCGQGDVCHLHGVNRTHLWNSFPCMSLVLWSWWTCGKASASSVGHPGIDSPFPRFSRTQDRTVGTLSTTLPRT